MRDRVGLRIDRVRRTGEIWHRLVDLPLASIAATPLQVAALRLARQALGPLGGTRLVDEVDALVALLPAQTGRDRRIDLGARAHGCNAHIVRVLDRALADGCRVALQYRVATRGGVVERYEVDPATLRFVGETLYLYGWAVNRRSPRTFKVARIEGAELCDEKAENHPDLHENDAFQNAVKAWSGAPTRVRVRLLPAVGWMSGEFPLVASQKTTAESDGSVLVEAEVAGIVEASRWVLSWGRNAVVLEPKALRELILGELTDALGNYPNRARSSKVSDVDDDGGSQASKKRTMFKSRAAPHKEAF